MTTETSNDASELHKLFIYQIKGMVEVPRYGKGMMGRQQHSLVFGEFTKKKNSVGVKKSRKN